MKNNFFFIFQTFISLMQPIQDNLSNKPVHFFIN